MRKVLLSFCCLFSFVACEDQTNEKDASMARSMELENEVKGGQWRVLTFTNNGQTHTDLFSDYIIEFAGNSLITATNGSENFVGNWALIDQSNDTENQRNAGLNMRFSNPDQFLPLNGNWEIISASNERLEFRSYSRLQHLVFEHI